MQTPENDPAAVRESLRRLIDEMRTLREALGSIPMGEETHPWSVVASRAVMEGFHALGIEEELRSRGLGLPDITMGTFTALKRLTQIADTALKQQEAEATDPETHARIKEDRDNLGHVQLRLGIVPWGEYRSLIPAGPPIDRTPRPELVAEVDAVMATAWKPPAEADDASVLKADAEGRRFWAEWIRLSDWAGQTQLSGKSMTEGDTEELNRISEQANAMVDYVLEAQIATFRTAVTVMHLALDEATTGRHVDEPEIAALSRVEAWLTAQAEEE